MRPLIGVDVGGTFTDVVVFDVSGLRSTKLPTTDPQERAVVEGVRSAADGRGDYVFRHGTTVATNALLEGSGARVLLVTSPGFEDIIEIGRQARPSLYDSDAQRPTPLVDRKLRVGHRDAKSTLDAIEALAPEAIAVGLLDAYRDASIDFAAAEVIKDAFPDIPVSVAADVSPGFREYERIATAVVDAYLAPKVSGYLDRLNDELASSDAAVMTSSGGLASFELASGRVGSLTVSGPAAGVVAADALRRHHGLDSVITFDMGGTSTDVTRIGSSGVNVSASQTIGGRVNRVPSMPIHTVGAGGGSIAWRDKGGALRVGPRSAGADPGPAAYGRGGEEPTVTDANMVLGYIPDGTRFSGGLTLSSERANGALERLGGSLAMSGLEAAVGITEVADAHIDAAIRRVSIEDGFDPRDSSLLAFGGAGGLHATRVAKGLGMRSVLVPPHAGAFSALGLLMAVPQVERLQTVLAGSESEAILAATGRVAAEATEQYIDVYGEKPDRVDLFVEARYANQSHELSVPYRSGHVAEDFIAEHRRRFGFELEGGAVEVVNVRSVASGPAPLSWVEVEAPQRGVVDNHRAVEIWLDGSIIQCPVWERASLGPGDSLDGPALVVDDTATTLVGSADTLVLLDDGTIELTW